ncbi:MAG: alanine dehydrogenase, partial [Hyphomonadaceae bacterium]|nr:alanine dehydrogenase [Hyphomonadaceae bacterium]
MRIGVPREIKQNELRVGLTPGSVSELVWQGHEVVVEKDAGHGIKASDGDYIKAGARILNDPEKIFDAAELIVKVKEPQLEECARLRSDHTLFTYLHLAANRRQTEALMASGCTAIAYETVTGDAGNLPLLQPMSEVAGRLSIQAGAYALQSANGGAGILLSGAPGTKSANIIILGGGVAGENALQMALGARARCTVFETCLSRISGLDRIYGANAQVEFSTKDAIAESIRTADLVIGAVLIPGALAPKLVNRDMLGNMKPGAVLVDISIDQGGCFETSKPTTHDNPTYVVDDIVHYCVANMPGAVPQTSTVALNNATLKYVLRLAGEGVHNALVSDRHLLAGLHVWRGGIAHPVVAG